MESHCKILTHSSTFPLAFFCTKVSVFAGGGDGGIAAMISHCYNHSTFTILYPGYFFLLYY